MATARLDPSGSASTAATLPLAAALALFGTSDVPEVRVHRREIEEGIEWLITLLDNADPDPDLEPYLAGVRDDRGDDREDDTEENEDSDTGFGDDDGMMVELWGEPSLGAPECHPEAVYGFGHRCEAVLAVKGGDQSRWSQGGRDDYELDDSDFEPSIHGDDRELDTADDEPSLSAVECIRQTRWATGTNDDRECEVAS